MLFTRIDLILGSLSTMKVYYLQVGVELDGGKYCGTLNLPLWGDSSKLYDKLFSLKYILNSIHCSSLQHSLDSTQFIFFIVLLLFVRPFLYAVYFIYPTPFIRPTFSSTQIIFFNLLLLFVRPSSTQFIFFNLLLLFVRPFLYAVYFLYPTPFIRPTSTQFIFFNLLLLFIRPSSTQFIFFILLLVFVRPFLYAVYFL